MPGEFYIEGKAEKVDLIQVIEKITSETFGLEVLRDHLDQLETRGDDIQTQTPSRKRTAPDYSRSPATRSSCGVMSTLPGGETGT